VTVAWNSVAFLKCEIAKKNRFFAKKIVIFSRFPRERHTTARAARIAPKKLMQNNQNRVEKTDAK